MISKSKFDINRARAAFSNKGGQQFERSNYYPFYKLPENKSCTLRFLPDANPDNELGFLIERRMHELLVDGKQERIACLEMYGEKCPICDLSRSYYKVKDTVTGKKYWHKKDYIAKALVVKDGLPPGDDGVTYQGDVVLVGLGKTLYDIIAHNISSGDLGDDLPCDIETGFDFIITRSVKPGPNGEKWSDYALSKFARQPRALEEDELAKVEFEDESGETPNFVDLATLLPKKPDVSFVEQMLERSLGEGEGEEEAPPARAPVRTAPPKARPADDEEDFPPARAAKPVAKAVPTPKAAAADDGEDDELEAQAFLAQIRAKRQAAKAGDE